MVYIWCVYMYNEVYIRRYKYGSKGCYKGCFNNKGYNNMRCLHSPKVHGRVGHALPYTPLTTSRHPLNTSNHSPKVHGRVGHALLADRQPARLADHEVRPLDDDDADEPGGLRV